MTKPEVIHFMQKIKAHYPEFNINEKFIINEWYDKLKKYDINDVYRKLDQHLEGEFQKQPPRLHYITRYLKTPEEKKREQSKDFLIRCNLCHQEMWLSEYEETHFNKCSSIKYIQNTLKKNGYKAEYEKLENMDNEEFKKLYNKCKELNYEQRDKVPIKKISSEPTDSVC